MNAEREARARRNYVSNLYDGPRWKEQVAGMPTDQVTAIYLRAIRDGQTPKKPKPEPSPERDIPKDEDDQDDQLGLF